MVLDAAISADGPMVDNPSGQGCGRDFRSLSFRKPPANPKKELQWRLWEFQKIRGTLYFGVLVIRILLFSVPELIRVTYFRRLPKP